MKKILFLTNDTSKKLIYGIFSKLSEIGYSVDENILLFDNDGKSRDLISFLSDYDSFLIYGNEDLYENKGFNNLLAAIKEFSRGRDLPLILIDHLDEDLLNNFNDILCVRVLNRSSEEIAAEINRLLTAFAIQKSLILEHQDLVSKQELSNNIEISSESYINKTIENLKESENRQLNISFFFYGLSFLSLVLGGYLGYLLTKEIEIDFFSKLNETRIFYISLKSLVILSIFIASSKLSFNLAKEYRRVALKNSDRLHAIRFGEFYLNSFKNNIDWKEIKEVFQHWNIDNELLTRIGKKEEIPNLNDSLIKEFIKIIKDLKLN